MDEAAAQGGELIISIMAAVFLIGATVLMLSGTDAGVLRIYLENMLRSAC